MPRRLASAIFIGLLVLSGCRASWQQPDRVVAALQLQPGDRVADIGAGDGYFVFPLAEAVGPSGKVYAVEVTEAKVKNLASQAEKKGYENVEAILAQLDDPLLPDQAVDLVFVCNTYHHIDDRPVYFSRLKNDLTDRGRVAIVELSADKKGLAKLMIPKNHCTARASLSQEMTEAGYEEVEHYDFLSAQHFIIYAPTDEKPGNVGEVPTRKNNGRQ